MTISLQFIWKFRMKITVTAVDPQILSSTRTIWTTLIIKINTVTFEFSQSVDNTFVGIAMMQL